MALTGLQLHHHAVRMRPDAAAETLTFYRDVLGLTPDEGAREVPGIPLFWMSTEDGAQVHVFGVEGVSEYDWETGEDPFAGHVAFGVPDIAAARAELDRLEVSYWIVWRAEKQQVFLYDAARKMVELHQIGTCRCGLRARR